MSLESIRIAFTPDGDGTTRLTVAKLPAIAQLLTNLAVIELDVDGANVLVGPTSVTLTGRVTWRNSSGPVSLVGSVFGNTDRLVFDLDIDQPTPWTIGAAFPAQPGMWRADSLGLTQADSYLPGLQIKLPSIHAENVAKPARLSGWLPMIGDLEPFISYLGPADLGLDGDLVFSEDGTAALTLDALADRAPGGIQSYSGAPLAGIGLRLTNIMPDPLSLTPGTVMSALLMFVRVPVRDQSFELTCPLLWGGTVWPLSVNLWTVKPTLVDGIGALADLFGVPRQNFVLPPGVDFLASVYLGQLDLAMIPPKPAELLPRVQSVRAVIGSDKEWSPPIPFVRIGGVGSDWSFFFWGEAGTPDIAAKVWGEMRLGGSTRAVRQPLEFASPGQMRDAPSVDPTADPLIFRIGVNYPAWDVTGKLLTAEGNASVPLARMFEAFNFTPPNTDLAVNGLNFVARLATQEFEATGAVMTNWTLPIGGVNFTLEEIGVWIRASQSSITGSVTALLYVNAVDEPNNQTAFVTSATYLGNSRWVFACRMDGQLELIGFLSKVLQFTPPAWVANMSITLTKLDLELDTGDATTGSSYRAEGAVVGRWHVNALGISDLALSAEALVSRAATATTPDYRVKGAFQLNKIIVTAGVQLERDQQTYLFSIAYDKVELLATTAWSQEGGTNHQVLNVQLRGLTLGDVLTYFVRLAAPASEFSLEAPWDLLNKIDLSNFLLTLDRFNNTVSLVYTVEADFGFIYVKSVGVRYSYKGKGKVDLILSGRILTEKYGYDGKPPLGWDVVDDPPPAVPGKGPRLLDLRYMGVGQHVTLRNLRDYTTIEQVITALRTEMRPVDNPDQSPIDQPQVPELIFDDISDWMIGFDFTLIDTVSVSLVLHDPDLYGILIALGGPKAGSLAGFSFELLYRKVTDDIGVFRVQVRVPDMFRQIDVGPVSITLGVITVEVYTNGNFMVDLGFPHNRSFADSFGVQVFPFIGRGGVYFASLTGATSRRVPVITNGNFDPVLELGIGLAVGLGKEFSKGPLKAGIYVEFEVIIEGVLAWYHPVDAAVPSDRYFWIQGLAGVTGKLYGEVDFKVIKISVGVELHAYAMVTIEAYRRTVIELEIGVEAHASIKILFVRISFSFSLTIHETFTLGSDSRTPWILAANQPRNQRALFYRGAVPARRRGHADVVMHTRAAWIAGLHAAKPHLAAAMAKDPYVLDWNAALKVFPDQAAHAAVLRLIVLPAIDQVSVAFAPAQPALNPNPQYRVSVVLAADNGDDADHSPEAMLAAPLTARRANVSLSAHAADVPDLSLNVLVEAFLRWALAALPDDSQWPGLAVAGELDVLAEQMKDARTADVGFAMANLSTFLGNNVMLRVCLPPASSGATTLSGASMPMPPVVSWTTTLVDRNRDFATFNRVDASYEGLLARYFAKLEPLPPGDDRRSGAIGAPESVASFVFRDAMLMLTKSAVEEAQTLMRAWPYTASTGDSLAAISAWFAAVELPYLKHADDTVDQVAAHFGLAQDELVLLNPNIQSTLDTAPDNSTIRVKLGVTPMSIATANAEAALAANPALLIGDIVAQVAAAPVPEQPVTPPQVAETLTQLANRFGKSAADVAVGETLALEKLLRPGAPFDVSNLIFANPSGLTLDQAAAVLFVRLFGIAGVPDVGYQIHAQLISENNPTLVGIDVTQVLTVATVSLSALAGDIWTVQVGDTLQRISAAVALLREPPPPGFTTFDSALKAANPTHQGNAVNLPPQSVTAVAPGETIADVALRLLLPQAASAVPFLAAADVLLPLAVVGVPAVSIAVTTSDTLGSIAKAYGLAIEQLGQTLSAQAPLFDGTPGLTVAHVPAVAIDKLVDTLQRSHASVRISGMISNFLMHGLRPPAPAADNPLAALHDIIGQQIVPDTDAPMTLTLAAATGQSWLSYFLTDVSKDGETLTQFAARNQVPLAQVEQLNPGAFARYGATNPMPNGLVLMTQPSAPGQTAATLDSETMTAFAARNQVPLTQVEALNPAIYAQYGAVAPMPAGLVLIIKAAVPAQITIDQTQLAYPDAAVQIPTVLTPTSRAPAPMPLSKQVPVAYGLQQHVVWQAGANPWSTGASNASPSLWPFPAGLLARASNPPAFGFALMATAVQSSSAPPKAPTHYSWATRIDIAIRRITVPRFDGGSAGDLANTYEVIGADTAGRQTLLQLWRDLPMKGGAALYLLFAPSQQTDRPSGLASAVLDPLRTFIVKTNLSTETASGRQVARAHAEADDMPTAGADFAQIDAQKQFVTLLWECSVVGGGGFVLGYAATDGSGLPEPLFGPDGTATVTLLAIPDPRVNLLKPYFNCVAVGDNVDPSTVSLAVSAIDSAEKVAQQTVSPGHVGFDFALSNPDVLGGQTPSQQLARQSYSLCGYALQETPAFFGSDTAMPTGPQVTDPQAPGTGARATRDDANWYYQQVIPISRYAKVRFAPTQAALPPPGDDPYAGIAALWQPTSEQTASTSINLWFQDLIGNISKPGPEGVANVAPMVSYTDPLKSPAQWPNVAAGYQVSAAKPDGATLSVALALQLNACMPGPGDAPDTAVAAAVSHRTAYRTIHFQLAQPDVTSTLTTNLAMANVNGTLTPVALDGGLAKLRAMAAASYVFLDLIAGPSDDEPGLTRQFADIETSPTFDRILQNYGLTTDGGDTASGFELLARANTIQPLARMLWGSATPSAISVPVFQTVREGNTLEQLFATEAAAVATLSQSQNAHLPLRLGQTLTIPQMTRPVVDPATSSLLQVAQALACSPVDLAFVNKGRAGLLRADFAFVYLGVTAKVGLDNDGRTVSLQAIAEAYTARGYPVDAVDLATLNQYTAGMFADGSDVSLTSYVVRPLDTVGVNGASLSVPDLVAGNFRSPNVFDTGVPVYVTARDGVAVPAGQPLEQFASAQGFTSVQLLQSLAGFALAPGAAVVVPGAAAWAASVPVQTPYGLRGTDTLEAIAGAFTVAGATVTPAMLADANADLPGVLTSIPITVGTVTVTPLDASSFNAVVAQFKAGNTTVTPGQIAEAIAATAGHLYAGGLLICPLTQLADGSNGLSLGVIAARFGVSASDFAAANAAMPGLVMPGVTVTVALNNPSGGTNPTLSTATRANDTFNSIAARLTAMGASASVTTIAAANTKNLLVNPAAMPVLPPAPVNLGGTFGPDASGVWQFAKPIFAIEVALTLRRAEALVASVFKGTNVEKARAIVAPASSLSADQSAAIGAPIQLEQFAIALEAGIPAVRVASGKVLVDGTPSNDLWAVVFGQGGIVELKVAPTFDAGLASGPCPWFFALRPLSPDLISAANLMIRQLVDGALSGAGKPTNVSGVDLEVWARAFLLDFDRMLSPAYASSLYRLGTPTIRSRIDELIGYKATLASAIAAGLDFVLVSNTLDDKRRISAVRMLTQRLLSSLTQGYSVSLVMQWDVTSASTPWSKPTVKLAGAPAQRAGGADNVSIGTTKITLADLGSADADPYINATLSVTNAQELGSLTFDARFVPSEIEFDINQPDGVVGYASSNWLRFVHPLTDTPPAGYGVTLGTVVAPLPLRSYPSMPQMKSQTTPAQNPRATEITAASEWRYAIDVAHPSVLHDELAYDIQINIRPPVNFAAIARDQLVSALAQYVHVAGDLWSILETLPAIEPGQSPDPTLVAAVGTFIDLAGAVSRAWAQLWPPVAIEPAAARPQDDPTGPVYRRFALSSRLIGASGALQSLTLTGDGAVPGPGGWPDIAIGYRDRTIALDAQQPSGNTRDYLFPQGANVPAASDLVYRLSFPNLAASLYQNAKTAAAVVRNAHLMPPGGPATREPFVFRTPLLAFADMATPLVTNSNRLPIGSFTAQDPSAIETMFHDVFAGPGTGMQVSVAVNYNYRLAEADVGDPIAPSLPVLLMPRSDYVATLPAQLAQSLAAWQTENDPSKIGGEWQFSVSLYSAIEPQLDRPILRLERIISPLPVSR